MAKEKIQEVAAENTATETIIDNIEALQAKIAAMREAQRILLIILRSRLTKSFLLLLMLLISSVSLLQSSLLLKQAWAL